MAEDIDALTAIFAATEPAQFTTAFFRDISATHSEQVIMQAGLRYLGQPETTPTGHRLAEWLMTRGSAYLSVLFDPDLLPLAEAKRATTICRAHDGRFLARVQQFLTDAQTPVRFVLQGMSALDVFEQDSTLVPLLRVLNHHESERVRSQAAKTLCRLRPNRTLVERQLRSPDARTRANTVEGLWGMNTMEAAEIFRMAACDAHHRVAVNAIVGLYYRKDPTAFDRLVEIAHHRAPLHRMAAIWAFGRLEDARAIPVLEAMLEDPRIFVRKRAAAVLERLRATAAGTPESPQAA